MTDIISARPKCEGWCHDPVRQPSCVGHFLDCAACVEFKRRSDHIDAQDAKIAALVEALGVFSDCADVLDEETKETGREWPDDEWAKFRLLVSDYRKARAALAAAKEQK